MKSKIASVDVYLTWTFFFKFYIKKIKDNLNILTENINKSKIAPFAFKMKYQNYV